MATTKKLGRLTIAEMEAKQVTDPLESEMEAEEFGEIQDNERETMIRDLFGLQRSGESRGGIDAVDLDRNAFELKSGTKDGITTGRDVGLHTLARYRRRYFLACKGKKPKNKSFVIEECCVATPAMLEWWMERIEKKLMKDFTLAEKALAALAADEGFKSDELERVRYLFRRGYTLNNPKINWNKLKNNAKVFDMNADLPAQLKAFVKGNPLDVPTATAAAPVPEGDDG